MGCHFVWNKINFLEILKKLHCFQKMFKDGATCQVNQQIAENYLWAYIRCLNNKFIGNDFNLLTNSCHISAFFVYLRYAMAQNSIWTNKLFLKDFVKISYFSIKWCPCSYRKGEPLTLNPLDITNFKPYLKWNGSPWMALTNKNFCSKSIFDEVIAFWKRWKVSRTPCIVDHAWAIKVHCLNSPTQKT